MTAKNTTPLPHLERNIDRAQIAALGRHYEEKAKAAPQKPADEPKKMDESMLRGLREMAAHLNMR